jgi:hypothetical protein
MATATPIPPRVQQADLTAQQIFERTKVRELQLSRLLMFYISGGLLFMLLPGTFLGVWNLISISGRRAAESISPAWIQAHGHAQVMGWIGSFILGIGYYSIPKLRHGSRPFALARIIHESVPDAVVGRCRVVDRHPQVVARSTQRCGQQ